MTNKEFFQSALDASNLAPNMRWSIENHFLPDEINKDMFLNNLWADHLVFELASVAAVYKIPSNEKGEPISEQSVRLHWDYPHTTQDLIFLSGIPKEILNSILLKYSTQNKNLFRSTEGYTKEEIHFFPNATKSFKDFFSGYNDYRIMSPLHPFPRYMVIAYPDVCRWFYYTVRADEKLRQQGKEMLKSLGDTSTAKTLFPEVKKLYKKISGAKKFECSDKSFSWLPFLN